MVENKRQHFVPQGYLKNFKSESKGNNIYCFNVDDNKYSHSKIQQVAQKSYFNESSNKNIEKNLSNIEGKIIRYIDELVETENLDIINKNLKVRSYLSFFMSLQFVRTDYVRKMIKNQLFSLNNELTQELNLHSDVKDLISEFLNDNDLMKEYIKELHIDIIKIYSYEFTKYFYSRKWVLLKNKSNLNFWTSDNPIVRFNPNENQGEGLAFEDTYIAFPLSSNLCLFMGGLKNLNKLFEIRKKKFNTNLLKIDLLEVNQDDVLELNGLQKQFCDKIIFSKINDFNMIFQNYERYDKK